MNTPKFLLKNRRTEAWGSGSAPTPPPSRSSSTRTRTMTLASKITVLRIMAIPFFAIALLGHHLLISQILFCLSVFSDALDGTIARLRGERTPLGAFLDPLADKLLLVVSYIIFSYLNWIPLWVFVAVVSRDLIIILGWTVVYILTGNSKIQPRPLGKITTVLQMAVAVAALFSLNDSLFHTLLYAMIAATALSAGDYVWIGNKRLGALE